MDMQLHHDSSSLVINDKIDVMYGKYFPTKTYNSDEYIENCSSSAHPIRIFSEVYGVFGDLTQRFATRMDNMSIPCPANCHIAENYLYQKYSLETLITIAEEPGFWYGVPKYSWFWLVFESFFKLSNGNLYLLSDWEYGEQLTDRYLWIKKSFGDTMVNNLIWVDDKNRHILAYSKKDILIDNDLSNIEKWVNAGGSAFYWPEIHKDCNDKIKILAKRFELLDKVVKSLN